jgi:hypothetical protein
MFYRTKIGVNFSLTLSGGNKIGAMVQQHLDLQAERYSSTNL